MTDPTPDPNTHVGTTIDLHDNCDISSTDYIECLNAPPKAPPTPWGQVPLSAKILTVVVILAIVAITVFSFVKWKV